MKKNWCYKSYVREKCIRKAFFHFFTGTKAHCKQIDPEGRTRFLSCRRILLLKSLAWERPSSFDLCARLSKVQSRNLELITLLQYFFGQLCYVSLIGFGSLYFGGIWEYFPDAYPGNAFCLEYWQVLQGLPVLLLWSWEPTVPLVSFWQGSLWNPWAAVQLMHSSAQLHKIQVSAQFRVATSAFISFCNCGSWLLLPFKGFVLKVMGNYWIAIFFRAQWVSSKPLSAHLPREFSRLLWKPSLRDVSPWKDCSQVLLGTAWPPVPWATGAFWKGHSAASLGMGGGSLLSFGLGFCRSFW